MEVMVPGLALGGGLLRLVADGRVGWIEQDERGHALRSRTGEDLRDDRPGVVAGHHEAPDAQMVEQGEHVGSQAVRRVQLLRVAFGLVRVANPRKSIATTSTSSARGTTTRRQSYQKPGQPCSRRTGSPCP